MVRLAFEGLPEGVRSGWPFILQPGSIQRATLS